MIIQEEPAFRLRDLFPGGESREQLNTYLRRLPPETFLGGKDELFYSQSLIRRAAFQRELCTQTPNADRWKAAVQRIDHLLYTSPILRGAGAGEPLHASNLFSKHPNYRRAYKLMKTQEKQFAGIDLWKTGSLVVGKTEGLYELWCLLKILAIWIHDYDFTLVSHSTEELSKQLTQYLRSKEKDSEETQVPDTFVLQKKTGLFKGMQLRLDYDKKRMGLQPDYFLEISYQDKTRQFCMDAKYRNYAKDQMTKDSWYLDLFEVALHKYLFRLGKDTKIEGSYILHSDSGSGSEVPRQYFWSNLLMQDEDENMQSASLRKEKEEIDESVKKICARKSGKLRFQEFQKCLPGELREAKGCAFGSVCFTPLSSAGKNLRSIDSSR